MAEKETTLNAENALAGAILVDSQCLSQIPSTLRARDFLSQTCRTIFQGATALAQAGRMPDPVLIMEWAAARGEPLNRQTVVELMEVTPTAQGAGEYARIVHESALRRAVQEAAAAAAADDATPLPELISQTVETLQSISGSTRGAGLIRASDVAYEPPRWLIEPYFQRGKGTLIQADPGTGKTAFVCAVAAAVSTGRGFLGLTVAQPGDVLMLSTEDDLGILRGRIEANGGDLRRIHFLQTASGLTLNSPEIEQAVRQTRAKLLIFDPFQAFLGARVDLFRANETRPILARLFDMCARNDCACIIVAHLGKVTQGKSAVNQSLGSVDIPGAMRSILHIARNPGAEGELIAVHIKSSNAPRGKSIAYTIGDRGGIRFLGFSELTLEDLARQSREAPSLPEEAGLIGLLSGLLEERGEGFYSYEQLRQQAQAQLGFVPWDTPRDLRRRLEMADFQKKLREEARLRVTAGCRSNTARGIRLQRWAPPPAPVTEATEATLPSEPESGHPPCLILPEDTEVPWDD